MRTIKFRAWDKKLKEMSDGEPLGSDLFWDTNRVFMQFTELKDRHGKEIYEGDIVKNNRYGGLAEIVWKQGEGSTVGIVKGIFGEEDDLTGFIHDIGGFYFAGVGGITKAYYIGEFEVIGNIHENPELLVPKPSK